MLSSFGKLLMLLLSNSGEIICRRGLIGNLFMGLVRPDNSGTRYILPDEALPAAITADPDDILRSRIRACINS
jgi:hypothetical protein